MYTDKDKKIRILIVDDDPMEILSLSQILGSDYTLHVSISGADAIKMARALLPDIILLDIVMPEMDGYEVVSVLKSSDKTKDIPIIIITGLGKVDDEEKGLMLGASDFIIKPFTPSIVKLRVQKQIEKLQYQRDMEYDMMTLRLANEAAKFALWRVDIMNPVMESLGDKNIWTWSQEFRDMLGFNDENDFPNTIEAFRSCLHPEDDEKTEAAFIAHVNDRSGKTPYVIEYRLRHKNGQYRYFDGFGTTLRDREGLPIRVAGAIRDITDRKRVEETIKEANERIRLMLDSTPMCCQLLDSGFSKIDCNKEAIRLFGLKSKRDFFERFHELYPAVQPDGQRTEEKIHNHLKEAVEKGRSFFELEYKLLDGTPLPTEVTITRIEHGDDFLLATYTRDLSEQKAAIEEMRRAEIAEESNAAKTSFLAMMSHEIRTPMNSIMGFAELALDSLELNFAPQITDYLLRIKDSTKGLLKIINDILDISKIESGKIELEHEPIDLYDIFVHCQSVILPETIEKGLELSIYAEPIVGKKLLGDPIRLYQALLNLLSNAVKFTDSGIVKFSSLVKREDENSVTVYFEVRDTGIGMTSQQTDRIFEPFIQAESSTTRNYGGTGLGLSITKTVVELMGGELSVQSSPGMGSTFSFEIDFETIDSPDDKEPVINMPEVIRRPRFEGVILVCDDNLMNQRVIREHLTNVGIDVVVAANGEKGIERVRERMQKREKPFDLIFMDIYMPVMDGIEAATKIVELEAGSPIVALTANIISSEMEKYRKHGMYDCLGKPFTAQELWSVLLKYLTPVSISDIVGREHEESEKRLLEHLRVNFVRSNQSTYNDIRKFFDKRDIELAERLAHTLKGNAGQIGEQRLREAAAAVEEALCNAESVQSSKFGISNDSNDFESLMSKLEYELNIVLEKLKPMLEESIPDPGLRVPNSNEIREIYDRLRPMLLSHNPECMNMVSEIWMIPGGEELARQIEDFEFKQAALTLKKLEAHV